MLRCAISLFVVKHMMQIDEKWIWARLPEDLRDEDIDVYSGLYLDGLKVMSYGECSNPDEVRYEAKDEEGLRWWQLETICQMSEMPTDLGDGAGIEIM